MDASRPPLPPPPPPPRQPYANSSNNGSGSSIRAPEAYPAYGNHEPNHEPYNPAYNASSSAQQYSNAPAGYGMGGGDDRYHHHHGKHNYQQPQHQQQQQQYNAYGNGPAAGYHAPQPQYGSDNHYQHQHHSNNSGSHAYQPSAAPYSSNGDQASQTEKPAADVWDFPDGARPSRTTAPGMHTPSAAHAYGSRPPVVGAAPTGPILDPTGPAYGKFKLERRCCGCRQRYCIITTFFTLLVVALILFFAWPRLPTATVSSITTTTGMSINMPGNTPIDVTTGMQGKWSVVLSVENGNFIPWPFKTVRVDVTDPHLLSNAKIGTGSLNGVKLSRGFTGLKVPVTIKYHASNATDPALVGMSNACDNGQPVSLNFSIFFQVAGLSFFKSTSTATASYNCQPPSQ
ncbi:hypothetical protein SYNPS1DRAFT_21198 [Syncephalis pseudoplumigaleata]|uniref:Late embryogenesis abundant protein LEA-2 subgroup domain-containing protein n=1 Tax=Syncephalis pseudoplumigaleata TaxID=1712513 RepID=A0A4P9Z5Z2_9FUNG|nr:hypothetical protein SYNPS1DRAFT_21198 [Syncephalis pseudoplumigaleata]|eukprot:RKP27231.1 hypothetical protein SYNPS1DRAFT_21198 [Syncephalis pseudoplumigaleata]